MYVLLGVLIAFFISTSMATLVWYDYYAQQTVRAALIGQEHEALSCFCANYTRALYQRCAAMRHALQDQGQYHFTYSGHPRYQCRCVCSWHDKQAHVIHLTCCITLENSARRTVTKVWHVSLFD